jgi:hypothetical protein
MIAEVKGEAPAAKGNGALSAGFGVSIAEMAGAV